LLPEPILRTVGPRYERSRFAALLDPEIDLTRQVAAFANTTGGFIVLGASIDPETGAPIEAAGIDHVAAGAAVRESLAKIDPPVDHLVSSRPIESPSSSVPLLFVSVSQSPSPPHLVVPDGQVLISVAEGVRHVQSRAELDALYQRGRSERELADRQIEAMIEKLVQAHYALYGIGFVACTQTPTAEPFLWARENPAALVEEMLPFSTDWGLTEETIKLRPAEIELRGELDAHGYIRVTRGGCVAVGEIRRRPPGNTLGSIDDVVRRVSTMVELAARILAHAPSATVVPRLFFEGLRGQRLVVSDQPYAESSPVELDTLQFPGNLGSEGDKFFVPRLTGDLVGRLLSCFKVELEGDPDGLTSTA